MVCADCPGEEIPREFILGIDRILRTPSKAVAQIDLPEQKEFYSLAIRWLTNALEITPKSLMLLKDF